MILGSFARLRIGLRVFLGSACSHAETCHDACIGPAKRPRPQLLPGLSDLNLEEAGSGRSPRPRTRRQDSHLKL